MDATPMALASIGLATLVVLGAIAALALLRSWWVLALAVAVLLAASGVVITLITKLIEEEPSTERRRPEAEPGRDAAPRRSTSPRTTRGRKDISDQASPSRD